VPEEALNIYLSGLVLNRPGGERVPEAVRVHLRDPALFTQPLGSISTRAALQQVAVQPTTATEVMVPATNRAPAEVRLLFLLAGERDRQIAGRERAG